MGDKLESLADDTGEKGLRIGFTLASTTLILVCVGIKEAENGHVKNVDLFDNRVADRVRITCWFVRRTI